MNLWFRLLWTMLTLRFRSRVPLFGPCVTRFIVWPSDLDVLGHVNNGRYLTWLDLARVDLMGRSGLLRKLREHGFYPVVASQTIHFRRPLKLFNRVRVETSVLGWDERSVYILHVFRRGPDAVGRAIIRGRFLSRSGTVPPAALLALAGEDRPSPELPAWIQGWVEGMTAGYAADSDRRLGVD